MTKSKFHCWFSLSLLGLLALFSSCPAYAAPKAARPTTVLPDNVEILKKNGVPVAYHVMPGITHYGIYREAFEEATKLELEWFTKHLKDSAP